MRICLARRRAGVPEAVRFRPKWQIALDEIRRLIAQGVRFGCVTADAEYGKVAAFRQALAALNLRFAVGILPRQHVYPAASAPSRSAAQAIAALGAQAFRRIAWRCGSRRQPGSGEPMPLAARFAAIRVRVADGPKNSARQRLPGAGAWLVCEQAHQQLKDELGLDHCECHNWQALHHHALMTLLALAFLQHLRRQKICPGYVGRPTRPNTHAAISQAAASSTQARTAARTLPPSCAQRHHRRLPAGSSPLSPLQPNRALPPQTVKVAG